ncbi:MAG: DUF499 domain-containing protein [Candidatus Hodarchaeota archaeon]
MLSWYEIILPHSMILSGHIKENLFIADLSNIIQGSAPVDYSNPQMFFQQTFLTKGLINLLNSVSTKLGSGEGSGIVKLQTPFGGGKTHALISIYHYATSGDEIHDYLPKNLPAFKTRVGSIVGTNLNPVEGRNAHNICIRTIWGDIAYQLAGIDGYKEFEANDLTRISPGKEKLVNFFRKFDNFLLLFDEITEYITKARGISVNESNLGIQTLLFLQELTEAIASLSHGLLVITLPTQEYEDFSETKLDIINKINRILGRVETTETPIEREDLYRLISKRLVKKVLLQEARDEIVSNYLKIYQNKRSELPEKIQDPAFFDKMKDSYPFHPELIDLLYDNWCSLPSFQGIRTILKILTRTLAYLWVSKEKLELILPLNINLQESPLKNDFLHHINSQFQSTVNSDVIGVNSISGTLDRKHPDWNNLASGISQTIFLSSFTHGVKSRGLNLSELKLQLIRPGITISLISEILHQLQSTLYYIHLKDGRYYFSHESNLNRKIQDMKELFQEELEEEMRKEIKKHVGKEFKTLIWPDSSNRIPDDQQLKIVLIHPSIEKDSLKKWLELKGNTFRQNKNTIIFCLPHNSHLTDLQDLLLTKLALNELNEKIKDKNLDISLEIKQRQDKINEIVSYHVRRTYSILYDGTRMISLGLPSVEYEPLTRWLHRELLNREFIVSKLHYRKLKELFLGSNQCISTYQILEQFSIDPHLFKIESAKTIQNSICWGVKEGAFGRAIINENKIQINTFFFSVEIAPTELIFASNEFLLSKEIAKAINNQIAKNPEIKEVIISKDLESTSTSEFIFESTSNTHAKSQKFYSLSLEVQDLNPKSLLAFHRGVVVPLEAKNAEISMKIELDVKSKKAIPETIIDTTLKETIHQLGARITSLKKEKEKTEEKK